MADSTLHRAQGAVTRALYWLRQGLSPRNAARKLREAFWGMGADVADELVEDARLAKQLGRLYGDGGTNFVADLTDIPRSGGGPWTRIKVVITVELHDPVTGRTIYRNGVSYFDDPPSGDALRGEADFWSNIFNNQYRTGPPLEFRGFTVDSLTME